MSTICTSVQIRTPLRFGSLAVFPLDADICEAPDYLMLSEALEVGCLSISEVDANGEVPFVFAKNSSDLRILLLEGEELAGARQNRVINASILLPTKHSCRIPVSCVEEGRWSGTTDRFRASGISSSPRIRSSLRNSVTRSLHSKNRHESDQSNIWHEIRSSFRTIGTTSATLAMSDANRTFQIEFEDLLQAVPYPDGANGIAVGLGGRVTSIDLFDKWQTCRNVWNSLLSAYVIDATQRVRMTDPLCCQDVKNILKHSNDLRWRQVHVVADGSEYRSSTMQTMLGSVLCLNRSIIHGSLISAI